jgi:hypothetical protein
MFRAIRSIGTRSRFGGFVLLLTLTAVACSAGPGLAPTSPPSTAASLPSPARSSAAGTPVPSRSAAPAAGATPKATTAPPTVKTFWAAVARGLAAAKHLQVTSAGPNPGTLRFQPSASATIAGGSVAFVCVNGVAYDGQSGFARVPGTWQCGAGALVDGFRHIGEPADSWNASSPGDAAITETVAQAAGGTWTWTYAATSVFLGGKVTARVTLDPASGRILAARRVDPTGTTTYAFDYAVTFPALAVPR